LGTDTRGCNVKVAQMGGRDEHVKERIRKCVTERAEERTLQMGRIGGAEPVARSPRF
jgi:hypothetical protein